MKKDNQDFLLKVGVYVGLYFLFLKPILNKLGLAKSKEEKDVEDFEKNTGPKVNFFNPQFYRYYRDTLKKKVWLIKVSDGTADNLAKKIHDCIGGWFSGDNETCVSGVFRSLQTQTQVSFLAEVFFNKYRLDLYNYIKNGDSNAPWAGLSDSEMLNIINIIKTKPVYYP